MHHACVQGGAFPKFLRAVYARHPCSEDVPWRFFLYYDGVGMKLLDTDARHMETVYWPTQEFDRPTLNCESGWLVFGAPRLPIIEELPGGCRIREYIAEQWGSFLPLGAGGDGVFLFRRRRLIVVDEVALKALFAFRGVNARLP